MTTTYYRPNRDRRRVAAPQHAINAYRAAHDNRMPSRNVYYVECAECGRRYWGSGIGIGSHRRACPGGGFAVVRTDALHDSEHVATFPTRDEADRHSADHRFATEVRQVWPVGATMTLGAGA